MLTCLSHFHLWKFGKHDNRKNGCSKVNSCGTGSHIDFADRYVAFDLNRIRFSSHSSTMLSGWQKKNTYGLTPSDFPSSAIILSFA